MTQLEKLKLFREANKPKPNSIVDVSMCRYNNPTSGDMAICFVFFNSACSKKLLMNYLYTVEKMKLAKIPYYTMELIFDDREPEIADAFHVRGNSVLFHKESLCNLLEKRIPVYFTKLLFLDADIIFGNPGWYDEVSHLLETYEAVQPFSSCVWLDSTYTKEIRTGMSAVRMDIKNSWDWNYHPGFAWAFQRKWFKEIGWMKYCVMGHEDTLSVAAWINIKYPSHASMALAYAEYCAIAQPKLSCSTGTVYHLWHGAIENRKYAERNKLLDGISDIRSILVPNKDGVWEVTNKKIEREMREYMIERSDDSV